ncbi:uncharacterized protein LOC131221161 isoform X2 [Magnolia sinica]|uniref:uncharacterized protein LOC131221161 isoform X2 n=1 Tax=Magnolia sinica TaxID=86752 RepID=UPI00265B62A2|nr:uncharacterized protein LOC131221161 isoform X2 [Magnolia sinica]
MRSYPNALLHQVEHQTTKMEFSILSLVILSFMIFAATTKEGRGSPTRKKADEEIKGKATATEETDQFIMHYPQSLQNVEIQYVNPQSDTRMIIVNNPSGRATNNQPTEAMIIAGEQIEMNDAQETGDQLPQASKDKHLEEGNRNHMLEEISLGIGTQLVHGLPPQTLLETQTRSSKPPNDLQPVNLAQIPRHVMASSPQTETEVETKELTGIMVETPQLVTVEKKNTVLVLQMERELNFSWGVIGLSAAMLGVYLGLLGNNRQISDHMVLYEASLWLLYSSLFSGLIMLMITIIRPCTQLSCSFIYGLMSLALLSGTYAISLGIYILLPKSTFRLVIVSVLPAALFLVAMILYFKDSIITTAQKFGFKPHQN